MKLYTTQQIRELFSETIKELEPHTSSTRCPLCKDRVWGATSRALSEVYTCPSCGEIVSQKELTK